jgi:hypothetical protein
VTDFRDEEENPFDSILVNSEPISKEMGGSASQFEKQSEPRI